MSRTVNSEWLFDESDRESLRLLIWSVADFCGVDVLTYTILSNHFHVLVRVPERRPVPPNEVFRRYLALYPASSRYRIEWVASLRQQVEEGTRAGLEWLERQMRQMGDVSHFMKLLKQRFTVLFNSVHDRHGTLWSERFKSVLVEDGEALRTMAAYIDLNPVRAGIVDDPKDYRFCGYAESIAGNEKARSGLRMVIADADWVQAAADYRCILFGAACKPRNKGESLSVETLEQVIRQKGKIPVHILLRCRLRYLTDGAVIGSTQFVRAHLDDQRRKYGRVRALEPKRLPPFAEWGGITLMRRPRAAISLNASRVI